MALTPPRTTTNLPPTRDELRDARLAGAAHGAEATRDLSELERRDRDPGRAFDRRPGAPAGAGSSKALHRETAAFSPRRRRWPGLLAVGLLGAGLAALAVSNFYDERTVGQRLDAGVEAVSRSVDARVETAAAQVENAVERRLPAALDDAGITAKVKTALAADPALSAARIAVSTQGGVVRLEGPAPDERARQRAEVLASAPAGVQRVDNRLVVDGAGSSVSTSGTAAPAPR